MAKATLKKIHNKSLKKIVFKNKSRTMKECTVKLNVMNKSFIRQWLKPNQSKTYAINIKIKNDRLKANNVHISSVSSTSFDIGIQIKRGKLLIEEPNTHVAETIASPVKQPFDKHRKKSNPKRF